MWASLDKVFDSLLPLIAGSGYFFLKILKWNNSANIFAKL
jgi:hypothetical protein